MTRFFARCSVAVALVLLLLLLLLLLVVGVLDRIDADLASAGFSDFNALRARVIEKLFLRDAMRGDRFGRLVSCSSPPGNSLLSQ